ncbi:MAG: hypothetical protein Kow0042_15510 [Calditrichia bacterium]
MEQLIKYLTFGFLVIFLFSLGCSDNPLQIPQNYDPLQEGDALQDTVLYAIQDTTYLIDSVLNTRLSNRLLLGEFKGLTARPILRFTTLPDSVRFIEAEIQFLADGSLSDANSTPFTAVAYPVLNAWESNIDDVWEDYTRNYDPTTPLGELELSPESTDTLIMKLNPDGLNLFSTWSRVEDNDQNPGILIDFNNASFIQYFSSRSNSSFPRLYYQYQALNDTSVTILDSVQATFDAFIYQVSLPTVPERNYVSTLTPYNTLVKFDLEGFLNHFSEGVEIVTANLQFFVDREHSVLDPLYGPNLEIRRLLTEIDNSSPSVDSTVSRYLRLQQWSSDSSYLEVRAGNDRVLLARGFVQLQLTDLSQPHGFLVSFINEVDFYSYLAFYNHKHSDVNLRPRLVLRFQKPAKPRF